MPEAFEAWPFWVVFVFFFAGAMMRGQAIYWLARTLTTAGLKDAHEGGWRGGVARWLEGSAVESGAAFVRRVGLVAVPLCYLTVGFQSAVLAAAGVVRIRALPFTLAQIPGSLAWAGIYTTIGWAVWEATFLALAGSWWGVVALAAVAALAVVFVRRYRSRRRARVAAQV